MSDNPKRKYTIKTKLLETAVEYVRNYSLDFAVDYLYDTISQTVIIPRCHIKQIIEGCLRLERRVWPTFVGYTFLEVEAKQAITITPELEAHIETSLLKDRTDFEIVNLALMLGLLDYADRPIRMAFEEIGRKRRVND